MIIPKSNYFSVKVIMLIIFIKHINLSTNLGQRSAFSTNLTTILYQPIYHKGKPAVENVKIVCKCYSLTMRNSSIYVLMFVSADS